MSAAWQLARGDFLERTRRYGFLVTLALSLYAGYAFLPPNGSAYVTLRLGMYRGAYNSAWVGAAISLLTATFLGLVGFYLIKNSVERDRLTGVGTLLAATPVSRRTYVVSKLLSNFAVLSLIALCVTLSGAVTQLVRGESASLQIWGLLAPYCFLTLPSLLVIAAVAVLFECMPGLRGGAGNVAYFFLWSMGMAASGLGSKDGSGWDFVGFGWLLPSMMRACKAAFPSFDAKLDDLAIGINIQGSGVWHLQTFVWNGISWGGLVLASRLIWIGAASVIAAAAVLCFDRFTETSAPATRRPWRFARKPASSPEVPSGFTGHLPAWSAESAPRGGELSRLGRLVLAETRLLLKGVSLAWFIVAAGLCMAGALLPLETARLRILPLIWIWPVLLWSSIGTREKRFGTDPILFSTPYPLRSSLAAAWLGGVVVALLTGGVIGLRLLIQSGAADFCGFLAGALFIPALALALGVWTGTSRTFEALYTFFWYAGPLQPIPAIDFMAASPASVRAGTPLVFLAATAVLLAVAALGRKGQIRS